MLTIASFNVENLDDKEGSRNPPLAERAPVLRRAMERLDADILCLQEVHGQELPDHTSSSPSRDLLALDEVVAGTQYAGFHRATTRTDDGYTRNTEFTGKDGTSGTRNVEVTYDPETGEYNREVTGSRTDGGTGDGGEGDPGEEGDGGR